MHQLPEDFAKRLGNFLINQYLEDYSPSEKQSELANVHAKIDHALARNSFETSWSLGGISNSYSGRSHNVSAEPEAELNELDDFLLENYPNIGFLQYKKILQKMERSTDSNSDCYGGSTTTGIKKMNFSDLAQSLGKLNLIPEGLIMRGDEVADYFKKEVYNQEWLDQKVAQAHKSRKPKVKK